MSIGTNINENTHRVILVDIPCLTSKALNATRRTGQDSTYTTVTMLISCLQRVGITMDDLVLLCCNTEHTWRKSIDSSYQRKSTLYGSILENLDACTPFHILNLDNTESYDIIATAVDYYKDKECIIISSDIFFEQLFSRENVKIFSPHSKTYKKKSNPTTALNKKVVQDGEILCEQDFNKRNKIYNLIHLDKGVVNEIVDALFFFPDKGWDYSNLAYPKLVSRWEKIYEKDKMVDPKYGKPKKKKNSRNKQMTFIGETNENYSN